MPARRLACLALVLALGACGRSSGPGPAAPTMPATALAPPPSSAHASPHKPAESADSVLKKSTENGTETVEDTTGDSGSHNPLLAAVASTVVAALPAAVAQSAPGSSTNWQEGVNYTRIVPAQPTDVPAGQVEVLEFFWYACPHCFALDPAVEQWRKTKPAYVSFARVPVTWGEGHRALARLFYTVKALDKIDQFSTEIFREIHVNGDPLVAPDASNIAQTEQIQANFAAKFGITEAQFKQAYDSPLVTKDLARADELVQRYRIDGVPTFLINGKYKADVASAGDPAKLLQLVNDLAAQEHKHP